jgi:nucleoside-diphosphate-sugar epimerase
MANLHTVAVTGASGMVGRHVAAALRRAGAECRAVDRSRWDLRRWANDDELDDFFAGCDAVVHAGAAVPSPGRPLPPQELIDANVRACYCLGDWARRRGKPIVLISGATVYAWTGDPALKEDAAKTSRPEAGLYGLSKLLAEQLLDGLSAQGLRVCILRPASVYGAGIPQSRMVATLLGKASRGEDLVLQPPTRDRFSLVHAADVAHAVLGALRSQAWDVFNVGGPAAVSVADIARACVAVVGRGKVVVPAQDTAPGSLQYGLDCSKAAAKFGYSPRIGLEEGLRRTLAGEV